MLAHPLETFRCRPKKLWRIAAIVRERKIERIVVGFPRNMDGSVGPAATEALAFAEKLRAQLPCPVVTWDERLTTVAANRFLHEAGRKTRTTREQIDQVAAQIILQISRALQLEREGGMPSVKTT